MGVGTRVEVGEETGVKVGRASVEVVEGEAEGSVDVAGSAVGVKEGVIVEAGRGVEVSMGMGDGEGRGGRPGNEQAARQRGSSRRIRSRRR